MFRGRSAFGSYQRSKCKYKVTCRAVSTARHLIYKMLNIVKIAFILASAALCLANIDPKSCRRCYGTYEVHLNTVVLKDDALKYVLATLKDCATGTEIDLGQPTTLACNQLSLCSVWRWPITTWRYCGNGGHVYFNRPYACNGAICGNATLDTRCNKSVVCHSDCKCSECGC